MALVFYGHPFSSYCQKALIALREKELAFDYRVVSPEHPEVAAEWAALWPFRRFPVLVDDGLTVAETSIIVEHLDRTRPDGPRLIPADPDLAFEARFLDRMFDHHVMTAMQGPGFEALRERADRLDEAKAKAANLLETAYAWLETRLAGRTWAVGDVFTLADCAAAPSLFYADWVHPIGEAYPAVRSYRARLLARPSVARAVDEGRPFRAYFPLGAPDRD